MVKQTKHKCPMCGKPVEPALAPFCSKRCADADLAKWLGGDYKIPTREKSEEVSPGDDGE